MRKLLILGIVLLAIFWLSYWILETRLGSVVLEMARVRATSIATRAINNAVSDRIAKSILYDQIIKTEIDNQGKIVFIQVNTAEVNRIASETSLSVQDTLKDLSNQEIYIPLGQVVGGKILAGRGPKIPIKVLPVGTVESSVSEEFMEKGINQTSYRLFVKIKANVSIIVPLIRTEATVQTQIPIANIIIPGTVPEVYFNNPPLYGQGGAE
ncbi:MAG TPA: sporulation protein YunB [Firmicutes bacterium]|nr:sporulation protein YunB [Bacillota bacterium]